MNLAELEGMVIGPTPMSISREQVESYVEITGDQPTRWGEVAPPGLASAALFAVAPELLSHPAVMEHGGAAVHGEQVFSWKGPLRAGESWTVLGKVNRARHRRGVWFVDFAITLSGADGNTVVEGYSSFLIAGGEPPVRSAAVEPEPPPYHRADHQQAIPPPCPRWERRFPYSPSRQAAQILSDTRRSPRIGIPSTGIISRRWRRGCRGWWCTAWPVQPGCARVSLG